ncbi:hypothetical protein PL11_007530 [Lentilactobacillus curieae]|uniref:D-alanyl-D-alanine carboxypeptidase n=1 Tax=Lentilactobacillus curieae TaxID=1138822 RepID=A0A1S6QJL5_9LACO|nr:hypothetical protein [Lentilactobacillus curieae]AQW21773.1 hypothetical protein PL11_007530 [Lentilactobacillus curieae]
MKKTTKLAMIAMGLLIGFTGIWGHQTMASKMPSVPSNYVFDENKSRAGAVRYAPKSTTKSAYLWNYSHTKRLHNIKNYPNSDWYVHYASVKRYGGNPNVYYRVSSANNPKIKGLIWSGYLYRLLAKPLSSFKTDQEYQHYINTNRSQRLAKAIVALFPNSKVSLSLSKIKSNFIESNNVSPDFGNLINFNNLQPLSSNSTNNNINTYLIKTAGLAITPRIKHISQIMAEHGYTPSKRASMGNYSIGIFSTDGAQMPGKSNYFTSPYPMKTEEDELGSGAYFYLATKN